MYNEVITLLHVNTHVNEYGDTVKTTESKEVFAQVRSAGMKESYEALALGYKVEYTFVLADYYDYDGQEYVEYQNKAYKVLRTFRKGNNELELVVTKNAVT